ncbi:type II secretion system F family protein [Limnoglobus roseus]|uniref:Type II secretion system F family protein n=1 Tax=Limnoglobus roseus TaxID=2598579 RepID=A0A5C1A3T8_9BACT|nr:type II secretion system F family protein [Limnoglobus roseus]QEL13260.1 type II secretion system F family protein [Limnoglobus roseus]
MVLDELTALAIIFAVTTFVAFLGMVLIVNRDDVNEYDPEPSRPLFGPANAALAGLLPSTTAGRESIQQDLWLAGYAQSSALNNFLCIRNLFTLTPIILGFASALMADDTRIGWAYVTDYRPPIGVALALTGILFGILGFALPRLILRSLASARKERLQRSMPVLMDTLGLCLSSGAGLIDSLRRSGEAIRRGHPDLSNEVRIVTRQAELRSLDHALMQWKRRIPIPEVGSLVFLLSSSDRLGSGITQGLFELSASYRSNARQLAEAAANRANFYLLFPTVLCLLAAAGLMLIGPPLYKGLSESRQLFNAIDDATRQRELLQQQLQNTAVPGQPAAGGPIPPTVAPAPAPPPPLSTGL